MARTRGASRHLTDAQIPKALAWHRKAVEFRRSHGTVLELAARLGTSVGAVRYCISVNGRYAQREGRRGTHKRSHSITQARKRSVTGRPRLLTDDAQVAVVMRWHRAYLAFHRRQGTAAMLAAKLGVSTKTLHDCIQRQGRYKQLHWSDKATRPERRLRETGPSANAVHAMRNALLNGWREASVRSRPNRRRTRR
jgi:hypothetical protein